MESYILIGLVVIFFILSFFVKRLMSWRGMPFVFIAFAVLFSVNAMAHRGRLFGNLIFVILALGLALKSFKRIRSTEGPGPS